VVRDDQGDPTRDFAGDRDREVVAASDGPERTGQAVCGLARVAGRRHPSAAELGECGEQAAADVA
jgi:hypothetical protein